MIRDAGDVARDTATGDEGDDARDPTTGDVRDPTTSDAEGVAHVTMNDTDHGGTSDATGQNRCKPPTSLAVSATS